MPVTHPRRLGRRVAASAAVALASLTGALAVAGPASAYTPCPPDVCDPPVVVKPKPWPWPGPSACLSCPRDRFVVDIRDLVVTPVIDRRFDAVQDLGRELVLDAVPGGFGG